MKVSEVNKILINKNMQDKDTNFKLKTKRPGGGGNGPRKPPKYFTDFKDQILDFVQEQRKFNAEQRKFNVEQRKFNAEQRKFNKLIIQRFDNLVKRNNLKE